MLLAVLGETLPPLWEAAQFFPNLINSLAFHRGHVLLHRLLLIFPFGLPLAPVGKYHLVLDLGMIYGGANW